MDGQEHLRTPDVGGHTASEGEGHSWEASDGDGTARTGLLVAPRQVAVADRDVQVLVGRSMVTDLYASRLVISDGYIGPERRAYDRPSALPRTASQWLRRAMSVTFMTALVVVPLTLISARALPPATAGPTANQSGSGTSDGPGTPGASVTGGTRHVFTASRAQVARAEAAYRRALARVESEGVVPPTVGAEPSGTEPAVPPGTGGQAEADAVVTPTGTGAPTSAQQARIAAQQERAAQQEANQQARASDQAAAAQQRASEAAARAQIRAAKAAVRAARSGATTPTTQPAASSA